MKLFWLSSHHDGFSPLQVWAAASQHVKCAEVQVSLKGLWCHSSAGEWQGWALVSDAALLHCCCFMCWQPHVFIIIVLCHPGLMLSVKSSAFPAFLSARTPGKFISAGSVCVFVYVCVRVLLWLDASFTFGAFAFWQCIISWEDDIWITWLETKKCCSALLLLISHALLRLIV